jgi:nucleoside-diphosphate-sugar epimerase
LKGLRPGYVYTEKDWNPITLEQALENSTYGYYASKTFAEKAAWDFVKEETPNFELTTVRVTSFSFPGQDTLSQRLPVAPELRTPFFSIVVQPAYGLRACRIFPHVLGRG